MDARVEKSAGPAQEEPWPLPEGWCWTKVDDALERVSTTDPKRDFGKTTFHYIDLGAIEKGKIVNPQSIAGNDAPSRARQIVKAGDTVFSCVRVYLQNIALVGDSLISPVASTAFCVLRPSGALHARYLNYFVSSQRFIEWLVPLQRGNSPPAVVDFDVKAQPIPLAPLAEQRRIVARVDALFAEIAEGEAALAAARKGLDTFRRALLKAAVTGELTTAWREANKGGETGQHLRARIKLDRESRTPAKGRGRRAAEARPLDTSALPELPKGWAWGRLGEIAESVRNGTSAPPRAEANGIEILRISAVRPLWVDEKQVRYLDTKQAEAAADATVEAGDLLFTRYNGSADLVGVGAIYLGVRRFYPDKIIRVRLHEALSKHRNFVELAVNCWVSRKHIASNIKTTAGQQGLSGESLKAAPVPIPPPIEATEILRRVSEALAAAADARAMLDAEAADAARLRQSILKAAFEGRLVPQDPTDEPASDLLAGLRFDGTGLRQARRSTRRR